MSSKNKKIGEILAAARKEQQKDLAVISESIKIARRHLEAVERGDSDPLPSPAYFQLFARSYAQYLGVDPKIFDEIPANGETLYREHMDAEKAEGPVDIEAEKSRKQARRFVKSLIGVGVLIIVALAAFIFVNQYILKDGDGHRTVTTNGGENAGESAAENAIGAIIDTENYSGYEKPEPLKLHVFVKQNVWASIYKDGKRIVDRELKEGEQYNWEASYRFNFVSLGISSALDMTLNGKKLAPLTERPQVITNLEINQINYRDYYPENRPYIIASPPPTASTQSPIYTAPAANTVSNTQKTDTSARPAEKPAVTNNAQTQDTAESLPPAIKPPTVQEKTNTEATNDSTKIKAGGDGN